MDFAESVRTCFSKYAGFQRCATRPEFWWFALFNLVGVIATGIVSQSASLAFNVVTFLPYVAVTTRRLHDTDRSGWWQLLAFVPVLGWILLIVWCCEPGKSSAYCAPKMVG